MGMGVVSDADFNSQLNHLTGTDEPCEKSEPTSSHNSTPSSPTSPSPTTNVVPSIRPIVTPGRKENDVNVPESLQKLIGATAVVEGRQSGLSLAEKFGLSPSGVSAYSRGSTSTASSPNPALSSHIEETKVRASKRATSKLMMALSAITKDKLEGAPLKDISGVARDMSVVVKNLEPDKPKNDGDTDKPAVQFIFYAPKVENADNYPVVHSRE